MSVVSAHFRYIAGSRTTEKVCDEALQCNAQASENYFINDTKASLIERPLSAFSMMLPGFLAELRLRRLHAAPCSRAPAAVDRYRLPAGRSAANLPAAVVAGYRKDKKLNTKAKNHG